MSDTSLPVAVQRVIRDEAEALHWRKPLGCQINLQDLHDALTRVAQVALEARTEDHELARGGKHAAVEHGDLPHRKAGEASTPVPEFTPEVIAEIRQLLADGAVKWAAMSPLERARGLLYLIVWECKAQGWMVKSRSIEEWLQAAEKEIQMPEPEPLLDYMNAETTSQRDVAFLRLYAAKVRDRSAVHWEIPNSVASTLEDIANRLER
jgi:hypothetical protein